MATDAIAANRALLAQESDTLIAGSLFFLVERNA
jgi:hypothetical protein